MKKQLLFLLCLLCFVIMLSSACTDEISIINLTVLHDVNQGEIPFEIEIKSGDFSVKKELSLIGSTEITSVPTGKATVNIKRYGATEIREITINKSAVLDLRLFGNLEAEENGEVYYTVNDASQLKNLSALSGATEIFSIKLASDIDLLDNKFTLPDFNGILDGKRGSQSFSINNFSLTTTAPGAGLFLKNHGTIKNIKMNAPSVTGSDNVGALAGENFNIIESCSVIGGTISGNSYVGGLCGIDYGMITDCSATSEIIAESYYGKTIGASLGNIQRGTFSELVGYSIKPAKAGKNAVSEEQTPLQMLLCAMDNWSALEKRTKLIRTGLSLNPLNFMHSIANTYIENLPDNYKKPNYLLDGSIDSNTKLIITAMRMIQGMNKMHASGFADVRLVYDGAEANGLDKMFAYCDAFVSDTSLDALLNLFGDFSSLYNPFSAAFFLDNQNDYLMGSIGEDATYVNPESETLNKRVIADFDTEVFWGNIITDFDRYCENELAKDTIFADNAFALIVKEYIAIFKDFLLYSDLADWDELLSSNGVKTSRIKKENIYSIEITIDGKALYKGFIDFINERLNLDVDGPFKGLQVDFTFNKPIKVRAEIWDNGNMKSLVVDDVDFTLKAAIPEAGQIWLENFILEHFTYLKGFKLNEVEFSITNSTPLIQMYSYSESDTDIELQKKVFSKDPEKYINFVDHTFEWMRRRLEREAV